MVEKVLRKQGKPDRERGASCVCWSSDDSDPVTVVTVDELKISFQA